MTSLLFPLIIRASTELFALMPARARACARVCEREREIRVMSESLSDPQKDAPLRPACVPRLLTFFLPTPSVPGSFLLPRRGYCVKLNSDIRPFLLTVHILQREALRDTRMKHKRRREPTGPQWLRPYFLEMVQFYPDSHE